MRAIKNTERARGQSTRSAPSSAVAPSGPTAASRSTWASIAAEIHAAHSFFGSHRGHVGPVRRVESSEEWRSAAKRSENKQWVYLIDFSGNAYAFGTASGNGERLVKSGLLQPKVIGKYDRRVEYLMLRKMHGPPEVTVYEFEISASIPEQAWRRRLYGHVQRGSACLRGFRAGDRDGIAREVLGNFRQCAHYRAISQDDRRVFEEFVEEVLLKKLRHPDPEKRKRTFYYGDSLEPGFFATIGRPHLEPAVERVAGPQVSLRRCSPSFTRRAAAVGMMRSSRSGRRPMSAGQPCSFHSASMASSTGCTGT